MAEPKRVYKFRDQLDTMDAEQIQEMLDSPGYRLVRRGLENYRDIKMRDLVRAHTEVETATLRGEYTAIEAAINMPAALQAEARKGGKKNE